MSSKLKWFTPLRKKTPRSIRTRITVRQRSRGLWQRYTVWEGEVHPHPLRVTQQVATRPPPLYTPPNCGSCRTPCINNRCRHVALTPWGTSPPCATLDPTFNPPQTFPSPFMKVVILELLVKSSLFIKLNCPKIVPCFKIIYRSYFWLHTASLILKIHNCCNCEIMIIHVVFLWYHLYATG